MKKKKGIFQGDDKIYVLTLTFSSLILLPNLTSSKSNINLKQIYRALTLAQPIGIILFERNNCPRDELGYIYSTKRGTRYLLSLVKYKITSKEHQELQ